MIENKEKPSRLLGGSEGHNEARKPHCHTYSNTHSQPVNIPIKAQGKIIGYLQDHTFIKRVQGSKHMLRKPPAWCISKQAFCEEVLPNTENIIIEDTESGLIYECPTQVFAEHAFEIQRGNFEPQLALGLRFWEVRGNGHHQLGLWGGGDDGR